MADFNPFANQYALSDNLMRIPREFADAKYKMGLLEFLKDFKEPYQAALTKFQEENTKLVQDRQGFINAQAQHQKILNNIASNYGQGELANNMNALNHVLNLARDYHKAHPGSVNPDDPFDTAGNPKGTDNPYYDQYQLGWNSLSLPMQVKQADLHHTEAETNEAEYSQGAGQGAFADGTPLDNKVTTNDVLNKGAISGLPFNNKAAKMSDSTRLYYQKLAPAIVALQNDAKNYSDASDLAGKNHWMQRWVADMQSYYTDVASNDALAKAHFENAINSESVAKGLTQGSTAFGTITYLPGELQKYGMNSPQIAGMIQDTTASLASGALLQAGTSEYDEPDSQTVTGAINSILGIPGIRQEVADYLTRSGYNMGRPFLSYTPIGAPGSPQITTNVVTGKPAYVQPTTSTSSFTPISPNPTPPVMPPSLVAGINELNKKDGYPANPISSTTASSTPSKGGWFSNMAG